jgi:hypothetical protein
MSMNNPNTTIDLVVYDDGKRVLDLPLAQYDLLNKSAMHDRGCTLETLADVDPADAYALIRTKLGSIARAVTDITVDNAALGNRADNGKEQTYHLAYELLLSRMPASYEIRRMKFSLGIHPSTEDITILGMDANDRIPIIDMVVEPPCLA